ncbi:hypothetical protein [Clostridium butyricum]|uniref:hypothetical protein n=1 Tax=Clostridium butyricum TaxID=1492 RepID=UPI003465ED56
MEIKHDLLPKQKTRKHNLNVVIDLYPYATELYEELDRNGIIERIKEIPQLGVIKVKKKLAKTRFDYVMLQLYLHKLIKTHLQGDLRYTYNNYINPKEFRDDYVYPNKKNKPSMGDIFQLLTIVYNIGHFYNTFTASRAITMVAEEDDAFYNMVVNACEDERYQSAAKIILDSKNYQRLHLLNSILILEQCDKSKQSISVALEILYAYINERELQEENKLKYAFAIFRNVRTVSYMAYDLQIAETPLTIDLCNEKAMLLLLKELLSEYNNNQSSTHLVGSITKLLDDTVYNENSNAICYYKISRKMVSLITKDPTYATLNYYNDLFIKKDSVLNRNHTHKRDYVQSQILKLTFTAEERWVSEALLSELEKINNTRVGYYDRHSGEQTILVSIKNTCDSATKRFAAYKTLKCTINYLRRISDIDSCEPRFLLASKFFLFYLFDENPVVIKPTISRDTCVICTRGKNTRIRAIQNLLKSSIGNKDENHEVEFLLSQIAGDSINDTTITIPASILVYQKDAVGRKLSEFDGMIIHPMRKENQVIFLEAKNRDRQPSFGKNCLKEKFDKFTFDYSEDDIKIVDYDAYWKYTI